MQARNLSPVFDLADRALPQCVDIEAEILGAILLDPNAITRVVGLKSEHFYHGPHRRVFEVCEKLQRDGYPCDLMSVAQELYASGDLEKVGGQSMLADLTDCVISAVNVDIHAQYVIDRARRRELIALSGDIARQARDLQTPLASVQAIAESRLYSLSDAASKGATPLGELLQEELNRIVDRFEKRESGVASSEAFPTGFYDIDAMTNGGFRPGELVIIAGRPAMGKTSFAMAIALEYAQKGFPSLVFSMEMSEQALARRFLAAEARIEGGRLGSGRIAPTEWEPLGDVVSKISKIPLHIDENVDAGCSYMMSEAIALKAKYGALGGVFVDYLQLMVQGDGSNAVQELTKITRQLKLMAKRLGCPVIVLSQLSRAVETRTNKRPMMSDLRDSGSIEQDSDIVLMLYRDEYYNPDTPDRGVAEVIFAKHRSGPTGTARLSFEPQYTTFRNLARHA